MKEEKMLLIMKHIVCFNLAWQWRYLTDKTGFLFIGTHCITRFTNTSIWSMWTKQDNSQSNNYCLDYSPQRPLPSKTTTHLDHHHPWGPSGPPCPQSDYHLRGSHGPLPTRTSTHKGYVDHYLPGPAPTRDMWTTTYQDQHPQGICGPLPTRTSTHKGYVDRYLPGPAPTRDMWTTTYQDQHPQGICGPLPTRTSTHMGPYLPGQQHW